ncbi:MAG: TIGR01620 family protein [Gemmobacter sp.]|nr:TIGR01620 family protein [Gemmobacter sp.]
MPEIPDDTPVGTPIARLRPVVIDLDDPAPSPATAPPVPDLTVPLPGLAGPLIRRRSILGRVFTWAAGAFATLVLGVAVTDFVTDLLARNTVLGTIAMGLAAMVVLGAVIFALREWSAFLRLGRIDTLRARAEAATVASDLKAARGIVADVQRLYAGRAELADARARLTGQGADLLDADALLGLAESELLAAGDRAARAEIEAAARRVATATALIPLALADVAVALLANLAMIRRIAEIYGGRAGAFGSWRLLRRVFSHLVATGAIAVGDDLIASVAGGGVLSKLSRRFGEGVVNGALTARVGIAAMEVCRPLPFVMLPKPRITNLLGRAFTGLFGGNPS